MSNNELLTDEYVAGLLTQDAKDCSLKYSAMGMEAFRDVKKPSSGLKPNTRFLRHIIRDTDAHNRAMLAKETAESRARLSELEASEERRRIKSNPNAPDIRRRQMGDIHAILGVGEKRPREDISRDKSRRRASEKERDGKKSGLSSGEIGLSTSSGGRRHHARLSERDSNSNQTHTTSDRNKSRPSRSRKHKCSESPSEDETRERRRRSRRDRSRSPRDERDKRRRKHRRRSRDRSLIRCSSPKRDAKPKPSHREEDSDPLEDFIGPPPPPNHRGRGTIGGAAALDRRFSESYDPKLDVRMEGDEDSWEDAVEAFRDRQKMRLNQDQRLKDAGFTDGQIQRVKSSEEKAELDVVWSREGEERQWDKGKSLSAGCDDDR